MAARAIWKPGSLRRRRVWTRATGGGQSSLAKRQREAYSIAIMFSRLFSFFRRRKKTDRPANADSTGAETKSGETAPEASPVKWEIDPARDDWKEGLPEDWEARRREILDRDNFMCQAPGCCWRAADIHHVIPRARGGNHRAENLVALCRVHHAIVHLDTNKIEVSLKGSSNRCTIVSRHWNRGALVPIHVRRFQRVTEAELKQVRKHFGLKCRRCGSTAWKGHLRISEYTIRIRCSGCNTRWKLEAGLREETGTLLATIFLSTRNVGRFTFDPKLIHGLEPLKAYVGCPECDRNGRDGFLIEKRDEEKGRYFGCTLHKTANCPYVRPTDLE